MKIKINVLNGAALDWAVAKSEEQDPLFDNGEVVSFKEIVGRKHRLLWGPSTNWAQGGVIIERERITLDYRADIDSARPWIATLPSGAEEHGATPLIAAMRVYAAGALGDSIDIPEELL
jgi:hypothetical protein